MVPKAAARSARCWECPDLDHLVLVRSFLGKLCPRPSLVLSRPPKMPTKLPSISTEDVVPFARGDADLVRAGELCPPPARPASPRSRKKS